MSRKIGFWSVFALVTGSQIGSGVFMLPANLAPFGTLGLAGWFISGLGAVMLALVFAKLCAQFPRTGGPHVYVQKTFGPTFGFFTGWTYWIISWISTPVVIAASVGYLSPLIGEHPPIITLTLEILLLCSITLLNLKGVKTAGSAEFYLTILKIVPLLVLPLAALAFFDINHFLPIDTTQQDTSSILKTVTMLTLWGFIGLETATTTAGAVDNPTKTIPRAVVLGTLCVALLYFMNSLCMMGAIPNGELLTSKAPYADTARAIFGGNWHLIISLIASIVCIGTLNAWILASGQIALGIAQDGLLPAFFARKNKHDAPVWALLISSAGNIPLLILTHNQSLSQQIYLIIDFSVTAFLFVYAICSLAHLKLLFQQKENSTLWQWGYTLFALGFCVWVISATSLNTLMVASLFCLSGIPVFIWQRHKAQRSSLQEAIQASS